MENIQNHDNSKRLEKEKQKLRAAKTVYKDGTKDAQTKTKHTKNYHNYHNENRNKRNKQNHTKNYHNYHNENRNKRNKQNPSYDKATKIFQYYNRSTIALLEQR